MALRLHYHPFSSYCQKALIALYEREVPFEPVVVNLSDPDQRAALAALWPVTKFPVLEDSDAARVVPEATLIIEYLDHARPGAPPLVPRDAEAALTVRLWDRFFDNEVMTPMQKAVTDNFRPEGARDAFGVEEAKARIARSWDILEAHLADHGGDWAAGDTFSLADCAAAPAMVYANAASPFAERRRVEAYFERLVARPSFARCLEEARPFRGWFPLGWPEGYL
jgi:glutathione S-transferase